MRVYLSSVLSESFIPSLRLIGKSGSPLVYGVLFFLLEWLFVFGRRGKMAMKDKLMATLKSVTFAVIAWLPFYAFTAIRTSYELWKTEHQGRLSAEATNNFKKDIAPTPAEVADALFKFTYDRDDHAPKEQLYDTNQVKGMYPNPAHAKWNSDTFVLFRKRFGKPLAAALTTVEGPNVNFDEMRRVCTTPSNTDEMRECSSRLNRAAHGNP